MNDFIDTILDEHVDTLPSIFPVPAKTFLNLYLERVQQQPDAVALVSTEGMLTYSALDDYAQQLARFLLAHGFGQECRVGICLERNALLLVAMLGILKAGGAYVILEPEMPFARQRYIIDDAHLELVLTHGELLDQLTLLHDVVELEALNTVLYHAEDLHTESLLAEAEPAQVAYCMYTSGSTGQPKGVMVEQQQLLQYVEAVTARLELDFGVRAALLQSLTADFGVTMVYPTLALGGVLHIVHPQIASDALKLGHYIQEQAIEVLKITPSHWAALVSTDTEMDLLPAQKLIFGGEPLRWSQVQAIHQVAPDFPIYNHYGPTEATVGCLAWRIYADLRDSDAKLVPLGLPLNGAQVYILDEEAQIVSVGSLGEIYIGGTGVARGYLDRASLTAERFVPDPFSQLAGSRLYRTGDKGRVRAEGLLEYQGRLDDQVKIHGYRVEPSEVAVLLTEHAAVREAVVLAREDLHHDLQLVAYIVPSGNTILTAKLLRAWMNERVPIHLIPLTFIFLESFPLLANGKLDRRALPEPDLHVMAEVGADTPRTRLELRIATLWQEVLGGTMPGIYNHFFEVGGHSLAAMRLLARIRRELAIELSLSALFASPTIALLASTIENLYGAKPSASMGRSMLSIQTRPERLPLSLSQQALWFFYQLEPTSPFYNIPLALRLHHKLALPAFEAALRGVVLRHEVLRTTFAVSSMGEVEQVVSDTIDVCLSKVDLSLLPPLEREARLLKLLQEEAKRPFVLETGPLFRVVLIQLNDTEYALSLVFHHIAFDGWSQQIFLHELSTLYTYYEGLNTSIDKRERDQQIVGLLPELPLQYVDYALWQRQELQEGAHIGSELDYWRSQLKGSPTFLNLPTDYPRPPIQQFHGAVERFVISTEVMQALKVLGQQEDVTLFMTLLAAFSVLLARYSGQDEVLLGSPVAHRHDIELEDLIGFFVNMLVLRCDLAGQPSFLELLQRVRIMTLEAYSHQDLPFEALVQELQIERMASMNPLFQVALVLQREHAALEHIGSVEATWLDNHSATAKFDLTLDITETDQELHCKLEYNTDIFAPATILRMVHNFQTLLANLLAYPSSPVSLLPMLHEQEMRQVQMWSTTYADYPRDLCIHELFTEQAQLRPDAIALVCGEIQMSYGELDRHSSVVAHHLRRLGVGSEMMVGTCFERSPEQIIAILGILKAGGCYVPIEPNYPAERLDYMFENTAMTLMLAQRSFTPRLSQLSMQVIYFETLLEGSEQRFDMSVVNVSCPANLAHVLYTSGSTGLPKGVSVTHGNVARLVKNNNYARLDEHEVLVQYNPIAFDASTLEMWCSLLNGARLVIAPPGTLSLSEMAQLFQRYGVTTAWITAGLFHQLVDHHLDALLSLRQIMAGGDVLSVAHVKRLLAQADGDTRLLNGYGPTENTVFTCCYPMTSVADVGTNVSIGRVIANTEIHVLDEAMQQVPIGVYGELYVGGAGLSRGYLRRPVLTAERYVPHPFSAVPGARLYRTGDIVRFVADGSLEFLGRADFQVKVRGFRIELGEIETALQSHLQVRDAVVIVHEHSPSDKRLVAYVLMQGDIALDEKPLRDWLRTMLPEYMLPSRIIALTSFPLSPNGKVDRRLLPLPEDEIDAQEHVQLARTPTEEILSGIWCQALHVPQIDIHANFFEAGGHSLLAMQILARIRQYLGRDLALRVFMEAPTIAHLAEQIELSGKQQSQGLEQLPELLPQARPAQILLSPAQQRLWFLCQLDPENPFYNIAFAVRVRGTLQYPKLEAALATVVRRHEILRTHLNQIAGEAFQIIEPESSVSFLYQSFTLNVAGGSREAQEEALLTFARRERSQPFALEGYSLMRAHVLQLDTDEHVLFFTFHHLIFDGWSQQLFLQELSTLYQAFVRDEPSPLPELAVQYADYALWQRKWLTDAVLKPQLAYWQELLRDVPTILELPTDYPRPPIQTFRGATLRYELPDELAFALRALGQREGYTLFMLFLSAFGILLSRLSNQTQILLGTANANRRLVELEGLLGFCVNTVLMRIDLRNEPSFSELLQRVRETVLQASMHQDVPFEKLVEILAPQRSLSHNPLFQVGFGFWSQRGERRDWGDVQVEPLYLENTTAKQDLMLDIIETSEGELLLQWDYNRDLFEEASIERWHSSLVTLIRAATISPAQAITRLTLLPPVQADTLLRQGRGMALPLPKVNGIHELIARQAIKHPGVEAVRFGTRVWSYAQLQERVELLAWQLRAAGIGPEMLVGVYMERSPELIVAILGVLSAGGAYVPLDVNHPQDRLNYMCRDAGIVLLLTQDHLKARLPITAVPALVLDNDGKIAGQKLLAEDKGVLPVTSSEQSAYVIYTSGSTGRPKGVVVSHRGICNLVEAQKQAFGSQQGKRILQFASLSFDASVWEIVMALAQGGTLVLAEQLQLMPGPPLQKLLHEQRINMVTLSPSVLAALPEDEYPDLQQIVVAGEACGAEIVARWKTGRSFYNAYGPTETTVCASVALCDAPGGRPPIGAAIANAELYVVDHHGELVPPGVPGELYIGGVALARGYLGRPELTAESFVPHPWSHEAGARLYRTQDQVRWRADGQLEYLGRLDQQVKIRGFRIELGEIESVLRQQEGVAECVVIVREDIPGEKRLVGYIVAHEGWTLVMSVLREQSKLLLPEYMVPNVLVPLAVLPITSNAKIDVKALPQPDLGEGFTEREYVAPSIHLEHEIAAIWCELLHLERVSIHDGFFDLGGHSLLLTRLQSRLAQKLQLHIMLVDLFQHTTISAQAAFFTQQKPEQPVFKQAVERAAARQHVLRRRSSSTTESRG